MPLVKQTLEVGASFTLRNENGVHLHVIVAESSPGDSATVILVYLSSADVPFRDLTTIIINVLKHRNHIKKRFGDAPNKCVSVIPIGSGCRPGRMEQNRRAAHALLLRSWRYSSASKLPGLT